MSTETGSGPVSAEGRPSEQRRIDSRGRVDIIGAVKSPLGFFVLVVLVAEAGLFGGTMRANEGERTLLINWMGAVMLLSVLLVAAIAVFEKDALYGRPRGPKPPVPEKPKPSPPPDRSTSTGSTRRKLYGEDTAPPAAGVWYTDIRPVLHQAIHYTVPTYYLDVNLMMVDWNLAFDLMFSRLGGRLRDKHVLHFINELQNFYDVMEHAQEFTQRVNEGQIPFVDVEPLVYASEKYGEVTFAKVAVQLHGPEGSPRGWSVSLIIREIEHGDEFVKDLLEEARKDKLWGVYSASYDRVLLEFEPYKQLIADVIGVIPRIKQAVVDLGAGTGNTTKELLAADYSVTAVENNLGMLDRLRSKHLPGKLTVVKSSIENLTSLADRSFDAAVMVNVLYAVDDPLACLQGVYRVLKPGGVLGLSTTHSETRLDRLLNSIKARLVEKKQFDRLANDYQLVHNVNKQIENDIATRHSRAKYREWIEAAGFVITKDVPSTYENAVLLIWAQKK